MKALDTSRFQTARANGASTTSLPGGHGDGLFQLGLGIANDERVDAVTGGASGEIELAAFVEPEAAFGQPAEPARPAESLGIVRFDNVGWNPAVVGNEILGPATVAGVHFRKTPESSPARE